MKTNIEVMRFGYNDELYAIAEKRCKDEPNSLCIFEVQNEANPTKEIWVSGESSVQKLKDFLNRLYDPAKHLNDCSCPECMRSSTMKMLLEQALKLFNGLDLNRDKRDMSMVHLAKDGGLYRDIQDLKETITGILEPLK